MTTILHQKIPKTRILNKLEIETLFIRKITQMDVRDIAELSEIADLLIQKKVGLAQQVSRELTVFKRKLSLIIRR
ncbi:MAG: hypothetical protein ACXAC8_17635 [Candidatus Hodarchaeales archaeon]